MAAGQPRVDGLRLLYVVPYLNDPAVRRRVRMLRLGGARSLLPVGFRRTAEPITEIDGSPALDLGRTEDARLARRVVSVAAARRRVPEWGRTIGDIDVVMARSLEALLLARAFRRRFAPAAPLVYESLDIHRLLLGPGVLPRGLRWLEARSMSDCALLVTSSPGFVREYFTRYHHDLPPVALLENKLLSTEIAVDLGHTGDDGSGPSAAPSGPPWRIGWFGLFRCRRSLHLLADLCRRYPDLVRVELRGRPAASLRDELTTVVDATNGMTYHGPYDRSADLVEIYSRVHFAWTPDFSETGANSDWLLPNRLYEAGPAGCVPIAVASVETGRWLAARRIGVLLDEPMADALAQWVPSITADSYAAARAAVRHVPLSDFVDHQEQAHAFVQRLRSLPAR